MVIKRQAVRKLGSAELGPYARCSHLPVETQSKIANGDPLLVPSLVLSGTVTANIVEDLLV